VKCQLISKDAGKIGLPAFFLLILKIFVAYICAVNKFPLKMPAKLRAVVAHVAKIHIAVGIDFYLYKKVIFFIITINKTGSKNKENECCYAFFHTLKSYSAEIIISPGVIPFSLNASMAK
jgi:hypothetical protein